MMGSMFDGMEIVVDVILGMRSRTELDPPEGWARPQVDRGPQSAGGRGVEVPGLNHLTREAPAKCSSLLVVLVMGQAKQAARSRAGAMSRGIKFYDVRPEA